MNMKTRQENLRKLRNRINHLEAQREAAIKTLVKTETALPSLRKQAKRLVDYLLAEELRALQPTPYLDEDLKLDEGAAAGRPDTAPPSEPADSLKEDGLDIPSYLKRATPAGMVSDGPDDADARDYNRRLAAMADPRTPEKKAERKVVAQEIRHAELTGKRRKMPLSGKAALDAIRDSR